MYISVLLTYIQLRVGFVSRFGENAFVFLDLRLWLIEKSTGVGKLRCFLLGRYHRQSGKPVQIVQLTEVLSSQPILEISSMLADSKG